MASKKRARKSYQYDEDRFPVIFNALSDRGRFRAFKLLIKGEDICVSEAAKNFGVTVSAASQQFRILELSGIANRERQGRKICYKLRRNDPLVRSIIKLLK